VGELAATLFLGLFASLAVGAAIAQLYGFTGGHERGKPRSRE